MRTRGGGKGEDINGLREGREGEGRSRDLAQRERERERGLEEGLADRNRLRLLLLSLSSYCSTLVFVSPLFRCFLPGERSRKKKRGRPALLEKKVDFGVVVLSPLPPPIL